MKITPTVGRVVWFYPDPRIGSTAFHPPTLNDPLAAIVAKVIGERMVNLTVFDAAGNPHPTTSVPLLQEGDDPVDGAYATWMPYQVDQAKKHAGELASADKPRILGAGAARQVNTSDAAIEQEIVAKGKTAPRVTPADIEGNIADETYFTAADGVRGATPGGLRTYVPRDSHKLLTFCVLTLSNGFTVTGESACASPENFDAEIGRKVARQNAVQKIWPLMGYALKQQLHLAAYEPPAPGAAHAGYSTLAPHQQRVVDEKAELDEKLAKLSAFFDTPIYAGLSNAEQHRLHGQSVAMKAYSDILGQRIEAFAAA